MGGVEEGSEVARQISIWVHSAQRWSEVIRCFSHDPQGGLFHIFAAVYPSRMEIELKCEPSGAFR
jgi:hypothetical protein